MKLDGPMHESLPQEAEGRSLDRQLEHIRRYGMSTSPPDARQRLLKALGIPKPKTTGRYLVKFGCHLPFSHPQLLRDCFKIIHLLGIDYTYLEKEYCCGSVPVMRNSGTEREEALSACKQFMQMNYDMARQKGAETVVYICPVCIHFAKGYFPTMDDHHIFVWDLIAENLEQRDLKITPTVMGYYGGCGGSRFRAVLHGAKPHWERYRQLMDKIEGLTIVDLANVCCTAGSERLVREAKSKNIDNIICPCAACYGHIEDVGDNRVHPVYLSDILLTAMESSPKHRTTVV